jgi:hypothetical protein
VTVLVAIEASGTAATRTFSNPQEALAYASSGAGFDVSAPIYLPPGYALVEIDVPPEPSADSGQAYRALLTISNGDARFAIIEMDRPIHPTASDTNIVAASSDWQIYSNAGAGAHGGDYRLMAPQGGAELMIPPGQLTDDEIVRILGSMPLIEWPAPRTTCLNDLLPPPGPGEEQDPWLRARAMLPPDIPVLRPTFLPAGLGTPALLEACVGPLLFRDLPQLPRYTVVYQGTGNDHESLVFVLGRPAGIYGNFPGPPTGREQATVRGQDAGILITAGGSTASFMLSWKEQGMNYQVRMFSSGHLTQDDLIRTAQSLVPVP